MKEREREKKREKDRKRKATFYKFFDLRDLESRSRKVLPLEGFRKISYSLHRPIHRRCIEKKREGGGEESFKNHWRKIAMLVFELDWSENAPIHVF